MRLVTTLLELIGGVAVVAGVALVNVPAALVVAGLACFGLSWRMTP